MKHRLTIFTPTFNRKHTLHKLYESLLNQTNLDFEWFIVDDGSSDNTQELIKSWIKKNKINIKFHRQDNSGKHVAHNYGVINCETEIFVCVDSDDQVTKDFVSTIYTIWPRVNQQASLAGIIALKGNVNNMRIGTSMPTSLKSCSISELYSKQKFKGDATLIFKTLCLKKYLFPVIDGEKFMTEGVVYDQLSKDYEMLLLNKIIYICEYLEDGLSANIDLVHKKNPKGYIFYLSQRIDLSVNLWNKILFSAWYLVGIWRIGYKPSPEERKHGAHITLAYPLAILLLIRQNYKRKSHIFKVRI
ncbi:glycosyltransferase family A protein [Exiguobacterium sp. s56]|uniref:glycosyltransferase family A protein n=1 Tax=Exiguobacterium sp. s56 TaxID=2751232 RepID=UPI001BE9CFE1